MPNPKLSNITIEDARLVFRNFSGKEGQYNREGDRNFAVILPDALAEEMGTGGWNIKYLKPRDEDDQPTPYVQVTVGYKGKPPRVVMISSRGRTNLGEEDVNVLDWAEIEKADLIIRPYEWVVNGKTGIKAYLQSLFITISEDELELKYADVEDSGRGPAANPYEGDD